MILGDIIRRNARRFPDDLALVFKDNRFTFKQYEERVNRLSNALSALGAKKGDRISVILDNCHQHIEIWGAAAKGGFVVSPLSVYLKQELSDMIGNAEPTIVIVGDNHAHKVSSEWKSVKNVICVGEPPQGMLNYEEIMKTYPEDDPTEKVGLEDGLFIYFTSGTTGLPKGPYLTHRSQLVNSINCAMHLNWQYHKEKGITVHPLYFLAPNTCTIYPMMVLASPVVIMESFSPQTLLEAVEKEKITTIITVPTMIFRILEYPDLKKHDFSSLRTILYGSAPMPVAVLRRALDEFGPGKLVQGYGLTEYSNVTVLPAEEHVLEGPAEKVRRLESCGREIGDVHLRIVREDGTDINRNAEEIGEIIIKGKGIMNGYFRMPEQTAKVIKDGWLHTGDLAAMDEGGYVFIKDRKGDMIISGGINIYPREIEEVLFAHPAVAEASVVGKPDEEWGEIVKAYIVLKPGMMATEQEVIDYTKDKLASYKKPKEVEFVDSLPKSSTGKILKRELKKSAKGERFE